MERSNTKQNPTCEEKRNSAIESLRIVAMLAIVLSHACVHSGFEFSPLTISLNHFFVLCVQICFWSNLFSKRISAGVFSGDFCGVLVFYSICSFVNDISLFEYSN